jgi:hypothetical protein
MLKLVVSFVLTCIVAIAVSCGGGGEDGGTTSSPTGGGGDDGATTSPTGGGEPSTPQYTLSDEQERMVKLYGNPEYLVIMCDPNTGGRTETWTYAKATGKMYVFLDGDKISEADAVQDSNVTPQPALVDPKNYSCKATAADMTNLLGSDYKEMDQSEGALNLVTRLYQNLGIGVSFLDGKLANVTTIDQP